MQCKFTREVENNDVCDDTCKYANTCTRRKDPKWQQWIDEKLEREDDEEDKIL